MKHYLSKILDSIDVIVYVADFRTYEILYINDYTKNLFGDIEGKICWQSLQNRQDGPCSFCTNNRIITSEGTPTGAYHWVFQNTITGQWFDIIDTAIEWKEGHFVRLEVATDITEHKKTEESLIESEKKYHSLVSKIPSVTWTTASDGKTTFISPNVEMIYGYTPDEIYKYGVKLWFERIHPVDVKKVKEAYNKLFKKEGGFDIEYRIKRKDGKWIWLHDRAVTTYEEDGIQFAYGVFDDITNRKRNEDSLKESEERFRQLAENITEVFYISNLQTHQMLYISPAYELIWGQSCESLYSNPYSFVEAIHLDYREHVKHLLDRQLLGEKTEKVYQIIRPDQSMRWIRDRAFPVKGDDGKVVRVIGIAEDITNQKMSEVKIRESEEHYHSLLEISPDAIVETGLDGKILYCNQQASKIHGYDSPAEMIGQDSLQSMFEEDIHIAQNNAALLLDKGYFKNITFRMRKKDGTPVPVEVSASLLRNAEGNPKSFIGYIRDITKRTKIDETLRESEARLRKSQKIAKLGFLDWNIVTNNIEWSAETFQIYGFDPQNFEPTIDATIDLVHTDDREFVEKSLKAAIDNNVAYNIEHRIVRPDGRVIYIEATAEVTRDDNETPVRMLGTVRDITERKKAEKERDQLTSELIIKNKELEQVLYVTSHDLRSPLVNVEGYGMELEYSLKDLMSSIDHADVPSSVKDKITSIVKEDIPESLHYIQTSVSKMNTLLKGILTLSRLGNADLAIADIDMNEMMSVIVDSHRFRLNELKMKTDISSLPNCKGDSSQINQVFSNLLENSVKYTDAKRPGVIKISGYKDKTQSVYCIEDNGIGISPEHQNKIFEIFHQLEPNRVQGEGMGLTIAHRIIEKHNGNVRVESELGKGSKFIVSLPS